MSIKNHFANWSVENRPFEESESTYKVRRSLESGMIFIGHDNRPFSVTDVIAKENAWPWILLDQNGFCVESSLESFSTLIDGKTLTLSIQSLIGCKIR